MIDKYSSEELVWDTTKSFNFYPKEIKNKYSEIYNKNYKKYNIWIDQLSKKNSGNYKWWLTRLASRDERISSLFHYIVIYKTVTKIKTQRKNLKIIVDSDELKKIIDKKNLKTIQIILKGYNFFLKRCYLFSKEFFLSILNLILIKLFFKFEIPKQKINMVDFFEINQKKQKKKYFGNFLKQKKENFFNVPTFLSYSPKNIIKHLKQKNILLKEYFINFSDIIHIFASILNKNFNIEKKFLNTDFTQLIKNEFKTESHIRSIFIAHQNYFFFKNLKKKKFKIENIVSWNENQIIDKGWSLGIKKFFPETNYVGYSGSTLHPQFFNLSPTKNEILSGAVPKKIYIIGKKFLKNRNQFSKNQKFEITNYNRFNFKLKTKKKLVLFLLSGIKSADEALINLYYKLKDKKLKNLKIKFHPILPSNVFKQKFPDEIKGNGTDIISSAYIVITSSYTSGLYESISNNSFTIMIDCCALDKGLMKDLKHYTKKLKLCENFDQVYKQTIEVKQKNYNNCKVNKLVRKMFFNN